MNKKNSQEVHASKLKNATSGNRNFANKFSSKSSVNSNSTHKVVNDGDRDKKIKNTLLAKYQDQSYDSFQDRIPAHTGKTRKRTTQKRYLNYGIGIINNFQKSRGIKSLTLNENETLELLNEFYNLKFETKKKSWEHNRQGVLSVIEALTRLDFKTTKQILYAKTNLIDGSVTTEEYDNSETSPAKEFSKQYYDAILNQLSEFPDKKKAQLLSDLLVVLVATGLRAEEWQTVKIHRSYDPYSLNNCRIELYLRNSKPSNNRGEHNARVLDISKFQQTTLEAIERMETCGQEWFINGKYRLAHINASNLLRDTIWKLNEQGHNIPLNIRLRSCRDQFASNMREVGKKPKELAALLGHKQTSTAKYCYGKEGGAWELKDIIDIPYVRYDDTEVVLTSG